MKCDMNDKGKISITPVDTVEEYAIKAWLKENDSGNINVKTKSTKPFVGFKGSKNNNNKTQQ